MGGAKTFDDLVKETQSSGNPEADLIATLFRLSDDDVQGCLQLIDTYSLDFIKDIMTYWGNLKEPYEEREKRARAKIEKATSELFVQKNNTLMGKDGRVIKLKINPNILKGET